MEYHERPHESEGHRTMKLTLKRGPTALSSTVVRNIHFSVSLGTLDKTITWQVRLLTKLGV
jgi:hypothetical protein